MKCVYVCVGGLLLGSRTFCSSFCSSTFCSSFCSKSSWLGSYLVKEFWDTGSKPNQSFLFSQMFNSFLYIISKEF